MNDVLSISQEKELKILCVKKTVDWLVNNTSVSVFDPLTFKGYQRKIKNTHCKKIVEYIRDKEFYFPSSIICATDKEYNEDSELRIVDGQHRIHAFKLLQKYDPNCYSKIKNYELPVIIMEKVEESVEIDTFITVNKTSKKVDTSLAIVLKNKLNRSTTSEEIDISKYEYLAVEVARYLNYSKEYLYWKNTIVFENQPRKNTSELITLNAFSKPTKRFILQLENSGLIKVSWESKEDIDDLILKVCGVLDAMWIPISQKWYPLFSNGYENRRIIQGAIGYNAIIKVAINFLKNNVFTSLDEFINLFEKRIYSAHIDSNDWLPGRKFSKFSSESGYSIVAKELLDSIENE